jgi:hypothetical protein
MLNRSIGDVVLWIQAKSGITSGLVIWTAVIVIALLTTFAFVCVAGYNWLTLQLGATFAGLAMAGIFLLIALIAATVCAVSRRRAKKRALLIRAARAHGATPWLLDPRILGAAMQAGRSRRWQRIVTIVLLGFLGVNLAREINRRRLTRSEPADSALVS